MSELTIATALMRRNLDSLGQDKHRSHFAEFLAFKNGLFDLSHCLEDLEIRIEALEKKEKDDA